MGREHDDPKQVVLQVGAVLKKLRKERKLSLDDLAERAGVSKLTLGNIERGETNPTIGVLWKVSKSLSIPLMALFAAENSVNVSRAGKGLSIGGDDETWVIEPIFQNANDELEMYRAYLQPNSVYDPEKHHLNTTELVTVMSGSVSIQINEASYMLNTFDAISFHADDKHSYTNPTDDVVVLHILLKYGR